jgi:hypothetical protein
LAPLPQASPSPATAASPDPTPSPPRHHHRPERPIRALNPHSPSARDRHIRERFCHIHAVCCERPTKEVKVAKVAPYHSSNPSDPDVYHDHDDCPSGQQIPPQNRQGGTGGYPRCKHCVNLG